LDGVPVILVTIFVINNIMERHRVFLDFLGF
jgi:hypothetical protein